MLVRNTLAMLTRLDLGKKSNLLINILMLINTRRTPCFSNFREKKYGGNFRVRKTSNEKVIH